MRIFILLTIIVFCISTIIGACGQNHRFQKHKNAFNSSIVLTKYRLITDHNDVYFEIKQNNFFDFYYKLFDTLKNTNYPGRYTQKGDTLYLNFYNKGKALFGSKAVISREPKMLVFFDVPPDNKMIFALP